jgi:signal transduction histidine kinase
MRLWVSCAAALGALLARTDPEARLEAPGLVCREWGAAGCAVYGTGDGGLWQALAVCGASDIALPAPIAAGWQTPGTCAAGPVLVLTWPACGAPRGCLLATWHKAPPSELTAPGGRALWPALAALLSELYAEREPEESFRRRERALAELFLRTERQAEENRKAAARELHDEAGQALTSLMLQIKLLMDSDDLEYIRGRLEGLRHITAETLAEVRRISAGLRPVLLEKFGLPAALDVWLRDFRASSGLDVEWEGSELAGRLPEEVETAVFRCVQESLTNVVRHSGAEAARARLTMKKNRVFLQISDNGRGLTEPRPAGGGLLGMEERARQLGGSFWVSGREGQGVTVNLILPLERVES